METLDGLGGGVEDVDQALVNLHLEGFATSLVDMGRLHYGEGTALGRQRNWAGHLGTGANGGVNDLTCALVDHAVVVGL